MTSLRLARAQEASADVAIRSWIASVVQAQQRIRDAGARPGPMLEELVASVSALVDAPARVAVMEGPLLICRAASWEVRDTIGAPVPVTGGVCGMVLETLRPYRCDDVTLLGGPEPDGAGQRWTALPPSGHSLTSWNADPSGFADLPLDPALTADTLGAGRSALVVPLVSDGRGLGVVILGAAEPEWFDETDEQAVVLLAGTAAAALAAANAPPTQPLSLAALAAAERLAGNGHDRSSPEWRRFAAARDLALGIPSAQPGTLAVPQPAVGPDRPAPDALAEGRAPRNGRQARQGAVRAEAAGAVLDLDHPADAVATLSEARAGSAVRVKAPTVDLVSPDGASPGLASGDAAREDAAREDAAREDAAREDAAPDGTDRGSAAPAAVAPALAGPTPDGLGLWEWDAADGSVRWSRQLASLLRLPDTGGTLAALADRLHPDDAGAVEELLLRLHGGTAVSGSFRLLTGDGGVRAVYGWGEGRWDGDRLAGAWGAVVDVTDPAQGTAGIVRTSLAALRAARDLTGLGVWEWQPDSGHLVWSPEMFRILGMEPHAFTPSIDLWHDFVHPDDVDRARRLDLLAADGDGGGGVETFRVIGADGELRHLQSWSAVVPAAAGRPRVVCGATVDVTRQVDDQQLLEEMSATDAVTGLGNRFAFDRRMQELLADPSRDVAVLLLDLDRFKTVNDSLGHQVGDRLLVEVAQRLSEVVPEGSMTVRMGGDEFVVVPRPGLGWLQVRRLAQAIVDALRMPYLLPESGEMLVCPASVGVTSTSGRAVGVSDLLREADLALYRAKDSGRDRYVVFDDVLRATAQARHRAERELRQALDEGRLALEYQPIVDIDSGRVVGAEALVRLRDVTGDRLLGPDEFIDVAEDTGLVVEVDCWVIDTAIAEMGRWLDVTGSVEAMPWLAINVSPRSMEHPRVARRILEAVRTGRVPRERFKVELTEHSFLGALPGGESALRQLLDSGILVGIDDFGTGYSALAYLQRFELDFMKIDRSFVSAVGEDARADAVVTAIVDLAHAHDMRVTAEGVETAEQAAWLRSVGCDFAQGFHFGRPGHPSRILP